MAPPDLNSVPPSPHFRHTSQPPDLELNPISSSTSQRTSHIMGPPPMPANAMSSTITSDSGGAGFGPGEFRILVFRFTKIDTYAFYIGPLRHPRPMTAADLHLVLEKEQEAVVCAL